jgi:hypothetical protein
MLPVLVPDAFVESRTRVYCCPTHGAMLAL